MFLIFKPNEICLENLLNIFSIMPGLEKQRMENNRFKKKENNENEEEKEESKNEKVNGNEQDNSIENINPINDEELKLFILKKEYLTKNSKVTDKDVHRKLYNDSLVNFLKNKVIFRLKN